MAAMDKAELNSILNRTVVQSILDLVPNGARLVKRLKAQELLKDGREWLHPVCLSHEQGVTYGDDTDFAYNPSINSEYDEIQVESCPIVLQSTINLKAINRLNSEAAIVKDMAPRFMNIKRSLTKRVELAYLYGQTGIAKTVAAAPVAGPNANEVVLTIDAKEFSKTIFAGMKGAALDIYDDAGTKLNTVGDVTFVRIDYPTRQVTVLAPGDSAAIIADTTAKDIFFKGSKDTEMVGLFKQITAQTGSIYGISKDDHELWRGHIKDCGGTFNLAKVLEGLDGPLSVGGLEEDVTVYLPHSAFTAMNIDEAALREYDDSYDPKKSERGTSKICFVFQTGKLTLEPHAYMKEGQAVAIPDSGLKKVGAVDMEFIRDADDKGNADEKSVLRPLQNRAAFQILLQSDHAVVATEPAKCTWYINTIA